MAGGHGQYRGDGSVRGDEGRDEKSWEDINTPRERRKHDWCSEYGARHRDVDAAREAEGGGGRGDAIGEAGGGPHGN